MDHSHILLRLVVLFLRADLSNNLKENLILSDSVFDKLMDIKLILVLVELLGIYILEKLDLVSPMNLLRYLPKNYQELLKVKFLLIRWCLLENDLDGCAIDLI